MFLLFENLNEYHENYNYLDFYISFFSKEIQMFSDNNYVNRKCMFDFGEYDDDGKKSSHFYEGKIKKYDVRKREYCIKFKDERQKRISEEDLKKNYIILNGDDYHTFCEFPSNYLLKEKYKLWLEQENPTPINKDCYSTPDKQSQRSFFSAQTKQVYDKFEPYIKGQKILFLETDQCHVIESLKKQNLSSEMIQACNSCPEICKEIRRKHPDIHVLQGDIKEIGQKKNAYFSIWYDMEETWCNFYPTLNNSIFVMVNLSYRGKYSKENRMNYLKNLFVDNGDENNGEEIYSYRGKSGKYNMIWGRAIFL